MAILLHTRERQEDPWEFFDLFGDPSELVTLQPPSWLGTFDRFVVRNEPEQGAVSITGVTVERSIKIHTLRPAVTWETQIKDSVSPAGASFVRVTNHDVSWLPGVNCPVCRQPLSPFELAVHMHNHDRFEYLLRGIEEAEAWSAACGDICHYVETEITFGVTRLGLLKLARRLLDATEVADLRRDSLLN